METLAIRICPGCCLYLIRLWVFSNTHTFKFNERQWSGPQGDCGFSDVELCWMRVRNDCVLSSSELKNHELTTFPWGYRLEQLLGTWVQLEWGHEHCSPQDGNQLEFNRCWLQVLAVQIQDQIWPSEMVRMAHSTHRTSRWASSGYWGDSLLRKNSPVSADESLMQPDLSCVLSPFLFS